MLFYRYLMVPLLLAIFVSDGNANPFFKRTPKPEAEQYVPVLIKTLKSDPDEKKRAVAAELLREFDVKAFPDILPALIDALKDDTSSAVRLEALKSIGRQHPITQPMIFAVQNAKNDPSKQVRSATKDIAIRWLFHGIRLGNPLPPNFQTEEPPLADQLPSPKKSSRAKESSTPAAPQEEMTPEPIRPTPPLMPTPGSAKPIGPRPLLPFLPTRNTKPESKTAPKPDVKKDKKQEQKDATKPETKPPAKPMEDGPVLNPPM